MLKRIENGRLKLNGLELEVFIDDLFQKCNTTKEIEWINDELNSMLDVCYERRIEEI